METAELIKWRRLSRASAVGVSSGLLTHARFASSRAQTRRKKICYNKCVFLFRILFCPVVFFYFFAFWLTSVCSPDYYVDERLDASSVVSTKTCSNSVRVSLNRWSPLQFYPPSERNWNPTKKKRLWDVTSPLAVTIRCSAFVRSTTFSFHLPLAAPSAARFSVRVEFVVCKTLCAKRQNCFRLDHQCRLFR